MYAVATIDARNQGGTDTWEGNYINCEVDGNGDLVQTDAGKNSIFSWNFDNNDLQSSLLLSTTATATYQHSLVALTGADIVLVQEPDGTNDDDKILLEQSADGILGEQRYYTDTQLAEGGVVHPYAPYERLLGDVYRVETTFKSPDGITAGKITALTADLDYPDIIETINDASISGSSGGSTISLSKTFRAVTSVQVTLQNTTAVTAVVLSKSTTSITVECRNASGTAVAGTVDLIVVGY